jgi:hypothetical protein
VGGAELFELGATMCFDGMRHLRKKGAMFLVEVGHVVEIN